MTTGLLQKGKRNLKIYKKMKKTNIEDKAKQIIEDTMKTLPKEKHYDPLNYFPDDAFEKKTLSPHRFLLYKWRAHLKPRNLLLR